MKPLSENKNGELETMCKDSKGKLRKCNILLVEDYPDSLEASKLNLERNGGFQVCTAIDAGSVLDLLEERCSKQEFCFDLVILDIDLPDVRGTTLARWIRKIYPDMPIILFTAYGRLPAFEAAEAELGVEKTRLITKPVAACELIGWCRVLLSNPVQSVSKSLVVPDIMLEHIQEFRRSLPNSHTTC